MAADDRTRNQLLIETLDHLSRVLPAEVAEGLRAINVQGYVESNVKLGVQYSASTYFTGLTAGENLDIIIQTGDKPVAIKGPYVPAKDGGDVVLQFFKNPTFTGGADLSAGVYNQNDINPVASGVTLIGVAPTDPATGDYSPNDATKPNITDTGTPIQPSLVVLGAETAGSSTTNTLSASIGLEQILAPNTTYLYRRTVRAATASFFGFSTWYEGELDLPRPND